MESLCEQWTEWVCVCVCVCVWVINLLHVLSGLDDNKKVQLFGFPLNITEVRIVLLLCVYTPRLERFLSCVFIAEPVTMVTEVCDSLCYYADLSRHSKCAVHQSGVCLSVCPSASFHWTCESSDL